MPSSSPSRSHSIWCVISIGCTVFGVAPAGLCQTISGRVLDSKSGSPLPGVNVYISGTTLGSATANDGSFLIDGASSGRQDLVASMVGYRPVVRTVTVPMGGLDVTPIMMDEEVFDAGQLLVTSERPRDWQRHLERFTHEFLGSSSNADDCEILNPYVLDFENESATNRLRASASKPLEIENRALGYRVSFLLQEFEVANWTYNIRFLGQPRFEELEARDDEQFDRWQRNRRKAYLGSLQHFLYSLVRGVAESEGFEMRIGDVGILDASPASFLRVAEPDSMVVNGLTPFERQFYSAAPLHVFYRRESEPKAYATFVTETTGSRYFASRFQHSVMVFDRGVTVHTSGYLYEPFAVTTYGYWVWERVADMVPRNYKPEETGPVSKVSED